LALYKSFTYLLTYLLAYFLDGKPMASVLAYVMGQKPGQWERQRETIMLLNIQAML